MRLGDLKIYQKFLSRNKLYTAVSVTGFSVSLMFVILLGVYVKNELSVDDFHEKGNRIYLISNEVGTHFANPVGQYVQDLCPEVECFCRVFLMSKVIENGACGKLMAQALCVDSTFFSMFSFRLCEGESSQVLAGERSVVLTRSFARKLYGEENPLGMDLQMDGNSYTITGIMEDMPQNTQFKKCDFVTNYSAIAGHYGSYIMTFWDNCSFEIYFLEKRGMDLSSRVPMLIENFKKDYWFYKNGHGRDLYFIPLREVYFSGIDGRMKTGNKVLVFVYAGIAFLILVVAVVNYINMTAAQSGLRGKEFAVKRVLGCSRRELFFQFLAESVLLCFFSFVLGGILAFLAEPFFNDMFNTELGLAAHLSVPVIAMAVFFIFVTGALSGLPPALIISHFKPIEVFKGAFSYKMRSMYSKVFTGFQYMVAIALLVCSFFVLRQTNFLVHHELGFDRERILKMKNVLPAERIEGLRERLRSIAGVDVVSCTSGSPLDGGNNWSFNYKGTPLSFQEFRVDSFFFDIFDIELEELTGVPFSDNAYYVNRKAYNVLQPDSISFSFENAHGVTSYVAGITGDFHFRSLHEPIGLARIARMGDDWKPWDIYVKISPYADLRKVADAVKSAYLEYNGGELFESSFSDDIIQEWYEAEAVLSRIMETFTLLTILIMIMGVFAMSLYQVRQKEKEIAVRKVNGATEYEIVGLLNLQSAKLVAIAFIAAVPVSYYAMHLWLEGFAYRIDLDWWVFLSGGTAVLFLSMLSVSWQIRCAARMNPVDCLKSE